MMVLEKEIAPLLPAAREGSREALGEVLEACRKYLLWQARQQMDLGLRRKAGTSDLVQDTLLEAQRDFDQFSGGTEDELLAWLRCLLAHNIANFVRRYKATAKRGLDREVELSANHSGQYHAESTLSDEMERQEQFEQVFGLLKSLRAEYREVITLWYQEKSFAEIGQMTNRSTNAARMLWMRAIERLQSVAKTMENHENQQQCQHA